MPNAEGDEDLLWYRINLAEVRGVLSHHQVSRHDAWYEKVHWAAVVHALDSLLQRRCVAGTVKMEDLLAEISTISRSLRRRESQALGSLVFFPIQITATELYNGGHRARQMAKQGVTTTPGACIRGDVGISVEERQLYPVQ